MYDEIIQLKGDWPGSAGNGSGEMLDSVLVASATHTHDKRYYTKTEVDGKLSWKANISHTHTKTEVGLWNVDNTTDLDKPISTATQTALEGKQDKNKMVTSLNNADHSHYPSAKAVTDALSTSGDGDMLKSVYDPNNKNTNIFDYNNLENKPTIWDWTISIKVDGAVKDSFTTNQAGNKTIDLGSVWKTYTAWPNITIDWNNQISATDTKYTAWTNVNIDSNNKISATDTTYSNATQLADWLMSKEDKMIVDSLSDVATSWDYDDLINTPDLSVLAEIIEVDDYDDLPVTWKNGKVYITVDTGYMYRWNWTWYTQLTDQTAIRWQISWTLSNQTDLKNALNAKQDKVIAWTNITIDQDWKTINATDTIYTAWANININQNKEISATDTTYSNATTSVAWLMSGADKTKLDWLATVAISGSYNDLSNKPSAYSLPTASASVLWWIKVWTNLTIASWVLSAIDTTYTAWTNITISSGTISATDTTYSAWTEANLTNKDTTAKVWTGEVLNEYIADNAWDPDAITSKLTWEPTGAQKVKNLVAISEDDYDTAVNLVEDTLYFVFEND